MFSKRNKRRIHKAAAHYVCTHHSKADNDFQAAMNIAAYKAFVAGCEYVYSKFINKNDKNNTITKECIMTDRYTVWVGGVEVNDFLMPEKEAKELVNLYIKLGYDDVHIEKYRNIHYN